MFTETVLWHFLLGKEKTVAFCPDSKTPEGHNVRSVQYCMGANGGAVSLHKIRKHRECWHSDCVSRFGRHLHSKRLSFALILKHRLDAHGSDKKGIILQPHHPGLNVGFWLFPKHLIWVHWPTLRCIHSQWPNRLEDLTLDSKNHPEGFLQLSSMAPVPVDSD